MSLSRLIARPMLSSIFLVGGVNALRNAPTLAAKAQPVTDKLVPLLQRAAPQLPIPTDPAQLIRINAATQIASGLMPGHRTGSSAVGRGPRRDTGADDVRRAPVLGDRRPDHPQPAAAALLQERQPGRRLVIAAGDTDGKPGVAWRARRVAKDARREAKHLGRAARREAKLAKAQLT